MHTRIKFCGLTRAEDVRLAVELGVDYIGLVFAPRSPRRLLLGQARMLRELVPEEIGVVALVMDNPRNEIEQIVESLQPDVLQFHGAEDDAFAASLARPFWKAIAMGGQGEGAFASLAAYPNASGFLFDGHAAGEQGGSGQRFDWRQMPVATERPCLLAGGLTPDNVALALRTARPWGVDVSSGIETAPGEKDAEKMRRFVDAVRIADTRG
ncbi:phosphoribosylanthranilate isomerase [Pseudoxanthomonas sp. CF385]|uniref:phosphoribosylanthranilate isomerase n=1 Tax=Pseudoxanthomonas sp. CF385 TaxID=1881042 RepID=UPI00088DE618|nr:phosphoribosylanthranilate isomerase [Pseudoxanthomonas sp. CF385]SDQ85888.1 phosphoribosylanthranilate isomerase [Pseudoxanthomonas sp. CF385]